MNFKTTIVLAVLLAVAGIALWFTRDRGNADSTEKVATQQKLLPDVQPPAVVRVMVNSADGKSFGLEKSAGAWRLTSPVSAPAQTMEVDSLVRAITGLESTNTVAPDPSMGLDKPRYTVDLVTSADESYSVSVGEKSAVGDSVYVSLKSDRGKAHLVSADVLEKLSKPASTYRDPKLVDLQTNQVQQVTINKPDGRIVLSRSGSGANIEWKITEPSAMPAEKSDVDDILFGLTGLRAVEFVSENGSDAARYQLESPRYSATLVTTPTTLPSLVAAPTTATSAPASQPTSVTIKFGRYDDVQKKNVLVCTSGSPVIAKVSATIIETIGKKPLELRDRKVVDVDAAQVSTIAIHSDVTATTKPTSRPASKTDVTIKRRVAAKTESEAKAQATSAPTSAPGSAPTTRPTTVASTGPTTAATTAPSTAPATTQAATKPATKWEVAAGSDLKPADDSKVDALLTQLHPLRATKYLDAGATTRATSQPSANYVVQVTTQGAGGAEPVRHEVRLVDPGNGQPLVGTYNGLSFEVDRSLIDRLSGDFLKSDKPPANETDTPGPTFMP